MDRAEEDLLINRVYQAAYLSRLDLIDAAYTGKLVGGGTFPATFKGLNDKGQYVVEVDNKEIAVSRQTFMSYKSRGSKVTLRVGPGFRRIV